MADLDLKYDVDHRTAAFEEHGRGILACLAGPGTGKTYSLLARSAALSARNVDQDAICYLTFIREIARAFVDDYLERFGAEAYTACAPRISTLHSFACRLIRHQGFRRRYDGELYFMSFCEGDSTADTFLEDLLPFVARDGCRTVPQLRSVVGTIKTAWQDGVDPATIGEPASAVVGQLVEVSRSLRLLDWDQTIPVAHSLLAELPEIPEWLAKIRHYFVDEYQDFNPAEQALIGRLSSMAESVVVVGDDDQSLYSGRGGSPSGIRALVAAPDVDRITLVKCYRSKGNIVTVANAFQAHMNPTPRPMVAAAAGGGVTCLRFKSSKAEVAFLTEYLNGVLAQLPEAPRPKDGVICLFPSKRVLKAYIEMLSAKVKCVQRGRNAPDQRLWLERVLGLLVRRDQRFNERLLLGAYAAFKPRSRRLVAARVVEGDISPSEACRSLLSEGAFSGAAVTHAEAYVSFCADLSQRNLPPVARRIATTLSLAEGQVLGELEAVVGAGPGDLEDVLEAACDRLLPSTAAPEPDLRSVLFLTMHGSKGLTRKAVVLPGMEEACLPDGGDPAGLPEKQRLFFVALTRATDSVLITIPHNRGGGADSLNFDMPGRGEVSSFIAAAGLTARYHA